MLCRLVRWVCTGGGALWVDGAEVRKGSTRGQREVTHAVFMTHVGLMTHVVVMTHVGLS